MNRFTTASAIIGRKRELALFVSALDVASRGTGSVHFLVGEGGIGKTRLAAAIAALAAERGFTCVIGRAFEVEAGIPYALFGDAFVPLLRSLGAPALQVLARGGGAEVATLFPALRASTHPSPTLAAELKPRLLDAFSRLLHGLTAREPMLLVLENLQWADPSSIELLHFIARSAHAERLLVLGTYNNALRDSAPGLRAAEQSLAGLGVLSVHELPPMDRAETAELVRREVGAPAEAIEEFVTVLHERTLGNPYFVEESIKALVASGRLAGATTHWSGWTSERLALPRTIRDVLALRLDRLGPNARRVATLAAVAGSLVPHEVLAALTAFDGPTLVAAIDELRADRILVEPESSEGIVYELSHPLLQDALYSELSRARLRLLHGEMGDALERVYGARALEHASELAVHFLRAADPAQATRASRYLAAAGRAALGRGANREAAETLSAALVLTEQSKADAQTDREAILDSLARARQRLGDYASASGLWHQAVSLADARGDDRGVAALRRRLGVAAFRAGRYDDALGQLNSALEAAARAEDHGMVARIRLARGAVQLEVGRADDAERDLRQALKIAEQLGAPRLLSRVHQALQSLAVWRGPSEAARQHGRLALEFATKAADRGAAWNTHWATAMHAGLSGDSARTAEHLAAATELAEELRSPLLRLWTAEIAIEYRSSIGEWDEALALAERTIADARAFGQHTLLPRLLVWTSQILLGRGEFERAHAYVDEAWVLSGAGDPTAGESGNVHTVVPAHVGLASWHLANHRYAEALAVGEAGLAIADRTGYVAWAIHRLMPIVGEAALFSADWERAERYGTRLRRTAEQLGNPLGLAWADACFALLRMLGGDHAGAVSMLAKAADALEAIPFVEHAALLRRQLAIACEAAGDSDAAITELRRAHDMFSRLGAEPALTDVRDRLRALGARPPARVSGAAEGALTAREAEIARLVAARKSNKEIGETLDISPRTVGTHLSNIFGKLGLDSRGALTDLVRAGRLDGAPGN